MNLKDKNISLQLYTYLCDIVGSEETVRTRRDIFTAMDIVERPTTFTSISSGSKAEGLDLNGSDYDQMYLDKFIRVYENLIDVQSDPDKVLLVMDTIDTKPGFTKLKLVNKSDIYIDVIHDWSETEGEETYISSKRLREDFLSEGRIIHGPCVSTADGQIDQAVCFRCKKWITPAHQWIHRSRTSWPDSMLVTAAVQYGVLFVPIGCKHSPNEDLQWRISFSVTEKMLIYSFSHTQFLCYALLKIILTDLIKPGHGDLLCSFFLKTIMFWLSEEINPSEWKPENMISCILDCINRLIYCVEYKTCLHYFIQENNLFEDRFTDNQHKALLETLRFIYESLWTSVFQTSPFQKYRLESVNLLDTVLSASELSCFSYIKIISESFISQINPSTIKRLVRDLLNRKLCIYVISVYSREVLQSYRQNYTMARNKYFYKQYKKNLCYFKISLRSESISTWLLLASLFYKCKRFQECLVMIDYCLSRCTPNMIHLHFTNSLVEQTVFKEMKQRFGLLIAFKYLVIEDVCFRYPSCLLPDELMPLYVGRKFWFPPVVYSFLLQFLCCHHLRNYRGKQNALHDLELTIRERYFVLDNATNSWKIPAILEIVKSVL